MAADAVRAEQGTAWLGVTAAGEHLAVPAGQVAEVARVPPRTRVPNAPAGLLGLSNLRGSVLPVVSLAALLGRADPDDAPAGRGRLLVLAGAEPAGVLVDGVAALGAKGDSRALDLRALVRDAFGSVRHRTVHRAEAAQAAAPAGEQHAAATAQDELVLLALRVAGQDYALAMAGVSEIMRVPASLAQVPRSGGEMMGAAAFHGGLLPVVSLAALLGLAPGGAARRIVVVAVEGLAVGLAVDAVPGTLRIGRAAVDPVPAVLARGVSEVVLDGICRLDGGRRLAGLLSPARLFDPPTMARLRQVDQAREAQVRQADSMQREQFVLFTLGDEQYGLPIAAVVEVVRRPAGLTRMPNTPDFVEGVMSLRGRAVPVIDLARRFGAKPAGSGRRVIVVSAGGVQAGLAVHAVREVLSLDRSDMRPAPAFGAGPDAAGKEALFDRVALHHAGRLVLLVSPQGVLDRAERDVLAALAGAGAEAGAA